MLVDLDQAVKVQVMFRKVLDVLVVDWVNRSQIMFNILINHK